MDLGLTLAGELIPSLEAGSFRFLGMPIRVSRNIHEARVSLRDSLVRMMESIDQVAVTRHQKLHLYKQGVCPRLNWPLLVEEFPLSWLTKELQPVVTRYLKKWAGLTRSAKTSILYLPVRKGGLGLPSLTSVYKKQQASRQVQLSMSHDRGVRQIALLQLQDERNRQRLRFRPATLVEEMRTINPSQTRQALSRAVKTVIAEEEGEILTEQLHSLPTKEDLARRMEGCAAVWWAKSIADLPPEPMKFTLNAALDVLPTNSNLFHWGKKASIRCPLCSGNQSLLHVLNECPTAMELRRYSRRHDEVLKIFAKTIQEHLPPQFSMTADLPGSSYSFPQHIIPTDCRPDVVWWSNAQKILRMLELTISFETVAEDSRYRKMMNSGREVGFHCDLVTVEVGSRGMVVEDDLEKLR